MSKNLPIFLSFFFVACVSVNAQEIGKGDLKGATWEDYTWSNVKWSKVPVKKVEERGLEFKMYRWYSRSATKEGKVSSGQLFYKAGDSFKPLRLGRAEVSPAYKTKVQNSNLTLYSKVVDDDGQVSYQPAVEGEVPESATKVFTFLFQEPELSLHSVDVSEKVFPMSSLLFINRQNRDISVKINGMEKIVKANGQQNFPYELSERQLLRIDVIDETQKLTPRLIGQTVGGRKGQRIIGVFYRYRGVSNRFFLQREVDSP